MMKPNLFAAQEREAKLSKLGDSLELLERHVDFSALAAAVDRAAPRPGRERGGRPPFPTEVMVRILLIQQLFNLSDEQMEFQLLDRLSFQRFAGLRHSSQIPDRTTIWIFKERLIKAGASESVFDAVNRQLAKHGYIARGGQMIDASIVQAPKQSLSKEEKAIVDEGAMPADWKPAQRRQKDLDARWTKNMASPTSLTRSRPTRTNATSWCARSRSVRPANTTPCTSRTCSVQPTPAATSWPTGAMSMANARRG